MERSQFKLIRIILADLWHQKWILLLAMAVVANGITIVYTSYVSRKYISQWDQMWEERDRLDIEWRNLLLEEQSQSEHSRITRIASKQLDMSRPLPKEEIVVRIP
ncbi:cell division protein FtsL [Shewanella violacea]|uniref:Cell division protein FtsL n=2 Tax=Shewanella violacea TaxID=60217 RepID=D4ZDV0_SHEVD|nr:cell division protein FtsL [Shewanella violacea]BAB19195.1 FtsL [Shewanella violacea]BAJ04011.1 cell division protein FtsL [Shewanella violacea DSS12]